MKTAQGQMASFRAGTPVGKTLGSSRRKGPAKNRKLSLPETEVLSNSYVAMEKSSGGKGKSESLLWALAILALLGFATLGRHYEHGLTPMSPSGEGSQRLPGTGKKTFEAAARYRVETSLV